jgi:hypothetical protein
MYDEEVEESTTTSCQSLNERHALLDVIVPIASPFISSTTSAMLVVV